MEGAAAAPRSPERLKKAKAPLAAFQRQRGGAGHTRQAHRRPPLLLGATVDGERTRTPFETAQPLLRQLDCNPWFSSTNGITADVKKQILNFKYTTEAAVAGGRTRAWSLPVRGNPRRPLGSMSTWTTSGEPPQPSWRTTSRFRGTTYRSPGTTLRTTSGTTSKWGGSRAARAGQLRWQGVEHARGRYLSGVPQGDLLVACRPEPPRGNHPSHLGEPPHASGEPPTDLQEPPCEPPREPPRNEVVPERLGPASCGGRGGAGQSDARDRST